MKNGNKREIFLNWIRKQKKIGSGGIRTHASEETGALNQRLRPLGHATRYIVINEMFSFISFSVYK